MLTIFLYPLQNSTTQTSTISIVLLYTPIAILNQLQTNRASLIMIKLVLIQPFQQKIYTYITWENQKFDNELPA
jgi:hypothetical protein